MVRLRVGKVWAAAGKAPAISVAMATMRAALFIVPAPGRGGYAESYHTIGETRSPLILDSLRAANFAGNFSRLASIRVRLALIPATIPRRCDKFPAWPGQGIRFVGAGNF